jgi:DNA ligase-1
VLLAEIARAWEDVGATRSRSAKVARLAEVLDRLEAGELAAGTAMLAGEPRQGRIGVGWRTVGDLAVPPAEAPTLTVTDVDARLAALAQESGAGSQGRRQAALEALWGAATATEQSFLAGLLLGNLRQGALEGVVLQAVADAAGVALDAVRRAAMLTGDLTRAARIAMADGAEGLAAVGLEVGRAVQPMLAQSAADVAEALDRTGPAVVETKLDGMRIQVHRDGDDVRVVTRSLRDVTAELPRVVAATRELPVDRVVLDGEAMAVADDGRPLAFQETMQSVGDGGMQPWFFDVLHVDGRDLLDEPLAARLEVLDRVVPAAWRVGRVDADDVGTAHDHLVASLAAGHEGVVVKSRDATYEAGRRGAGWVKVKVAHTLDLVVLAVEWGSGRRRGWLSNLHLGARDAETGDFVMLGKTFKGLTDELLAWQTDQLLAREVRREGHVVHVRPDLVVEVAFDGVQRSTRYPGGMALRFARVKRYRPDKDATQADTVTTVREIHEGTRTPDPPDVTGRSD